MNVKRPYSDFDCRFIAARGLFAFLLSLVLALAGGYSTAAESPAASYPNRPVRIIVGFAPGGTADIVARIMAEKLAEDWKQTVVVDNRPGASGAIGADIVAKSPKDGYTLGIISGTFTLVPALGQKLPFDVTKDFSIINRVVEAPSIVTVGNSPNLANAKTFADFVAAARSKPKQLSYVSSGPGSTSHLKTEMLASAINAEFLHVPYKGSGAAITDLIAGRVDFMLGSVPEVIGYVRNKSLRPIVVASAKRLPSLPDVPSLSESIKGLELGNWFAFAGPAGPGRERGAASLRGGRGGSFRRRRRDHRPA